MPIKSRIRTIPHYPHDGIMFRDITTLLKDPIDIPMTTVMRLLEGPIAMVPCVSLNFYEKCDDCPDENACAVHNIMLKVRDKTLEIFRNTTLADLSN